MTSSGNSKIGKEKDISFDIKVATFKLASRYIHKLPMYLHLFT